MGIRSLNTFIKKNFPDCISNNNIEKYSGKIFAIDASILIYKFRYMSHLNETSYISGLINRIHYYLINNIIPVFVFDGIPPIEKNETLKKRSNIKNKIKNKIEILSSIKTEIDKREIDKEINKLSNQLIYVNKYHILECKKLLRLMGIPYFEAPDEAEKYCVYLHNEKFVDYIVTDDTDVLTFGGYKVLKTCIKNEIQEIDLNRFLIDINYTYDKFVDFCILSGCDYLPFIPNLAINTVFNLFKKYNNIEDIMNLNKYTFPDNYDYKNIKKIFMNFDYNLENVEIKLNNINFYELKIFLENLQIKNINNIIDKLKILKIN